MISKTNLHLAAGDNLNVNFYNTHFFKVKEDEFDEENCLDNPHLSGINGKVKELCVVWVSQKWSVLCLCLNDDRFCVR